MKSARSHLRIVEPDERAIPPSSRRVADVLHTIGRGACVGSGVVLRFLLWVAVGFTIVLVW